MASSRKLAVPLAGSTTLTRVDGAPVSSELAQFAAAWQTEVAGEPKRCVVRCDGLIKNAKADDGSPGFPCGVLSVRYTIGGLTKETLVDAVCQSALVVWAQSVDVVPVWDDRRIERLQRQTDATSPCAQQQLAAAITSSETHGDSGAGDARYLDVLASDSDDDTTEWSIHPVPEGARGLRFLDALIGGVMTSTPGLTTVIAWSCQKFDQYPAGVVQLDTNGATDTSILIAPAGARYLFLGFPSGTVDSFDVPSWLEWILSPNTLPGY